MSLFKHKKTVWLLDGVQVPAGTPGAEKKVEASKKWYARVVDENGKSKNVPLSSDKKAAFTLLGDLLKKIERRKAGIESELDDESLRPMAEVLKEFLAHLRGKGNVSDHNDHVETRLEKIVAGCKFKTLRDIDATRFTNWLELFSITHDLAQSTQNHYRVHLKTLIKWAMKEGRLNRDPLANVVASQTIVERTNNRRALESDEVQALLDATVKSETSFRGLNGVERHALYLTAFSTGFRANALHSLRPMDFDLDGPQPTVTLSKQADKSRKGKEQPLPPDVVPTLKAFLADRPAKERVWQGLKWKKWAATMIRRDAEAAGIASEQEGPDGLERLDFHCTRHTYLTSLGRAGVELRTAQILAGHSSPTLTARYSHRRLHDLTSAVGKLSFPTSSVDAPQTMRATGTEGKLVVTPVVQLLDNSPHSDAEPCKVGMNSGRMENLTKPQELQGNDAISRRKEGDERDMEIVEWKGVEPSTYALRTRCSPN